MRTPVPLVDLEPGVVVQVGGRPSPVTASVWLKQGEFVWSEHQFTELGVGTQWLSVEDDDGLLVTLWTPRPDLAGGRPEGRWMRIDGRRWTRKEKGEVDYLAEGRSPYGPSGRCEYADYRNGDERLSFERFGNLAWEVSTGRTIPASSVTAYREDDGAPRA